jgi:hypothetical protein
MNLCGPDGDSEYRILARKPFVKRTHGRPRSRWKENVNLNLCEIGYVNDCV